MIDIKEQQMIKRLSSEGLSQRRIAKEVGVSRTTVSLYISDPDRGVQLTKRRANAKPRRISALAQADQEALKAEYEKAGYNSTLLADVLNNDPGRVGLTSDFSLHERSVRRYVKKHFRPPVIVKHKAINRFEVEVGQQMQIDFTHAEFIFPGDKVAKNILVFEAVYTWSHKQFFWLCPDMTQASWLRAITECLLRFGVPREILCDNDKSLVLANDGKGNVRFHPDFEFFCKHFGINMKACKPARPQTKGAVERGGKYVKGTGFKWVNCYRPNVKTLDELNAAIQDWVAEYSDVKRSFDSVINGVEKQWTVKELYAYERKFLKFVERDRFLIALTYRMVKVDDEGHLHIHGVRISVPSKFIGKDVCVIVCAEGEYRVSDYRGNKLAEGFISKEQLIKCRFDAITDSDSKTKTVAKSDDSSTRVAKDKFFEEYYLDSSDF